MAKNNKNGSNGSHSLLNLLAMVLIFAAAVVVILNWILVQFNLDAGVLNNIVSWLVNIAYLIGFFFLALYAYGFVVSKSGKSKSTWMIIFVLSVLVLIVFLFLGWF